MHKIAYKLMSRLFFDIKTDLSINNLITTHRSNSKMLFIGRMGSVEAKAVIYYRYPILRRLTRLFMGFENLRYSVLRRNAGMWTNNESGVLQFGQIYYKAANKVDYLGSWRVEEICLRTQKVPLFNLEPYFNSMPWTLSLGNSRILVVHPFIASINHQLSVGLNKIHHKAYFHPDARFKTYKAFQGIGIGEVNFSWFEKLDEMVKEIKAIEYDVVLIACGAFGLPLGAALKDEGKIVIHMGGSLQLLFGVKGKRWENDIRFKDIITNRFISPLPQDIPNNFEKVEEGCYW